ncbi:MAG TPA: phenylalanine--tRNA ligase subunit alpha, partial [Tetragenococcus sp.]|nr:phenylalanine--tRNA ligase subunit alpha [Tetragenococcus sp.]
MSLKEQLEEVRDEALKSIENLNDLESLNQLRVKVLGKKGPITQTLRGMKDLSSKERPKIGSFANQVRDTLTQEIESKKTLLEEEALNRELKEQSIDVTLSGKQIPQGNRHVLTQIIEEIEDIFVGMGYQVIEGYEVEQDHYNFERMNIPKNHPARDMQDTFYISDELLIRTHTSPVQARTME